MNNLIRDFRQAWRGLLKSPVVSLVAVLALALGIGVNTSSFTAVNTIVLHPMKYPHLERVMTLWETIPKLPGEFDAVSPANFLDWKDQEQAFERIAAYRTWNVNLTGVDDPERLQGCLASPSFFPLLGLKPLFGRTISSDEDQPGRDNVVVVSHGFWQRRLASAPDVVGKTISLNGRAYTVVGVMPEDFDYPLATDLWAPLTLTNEEKNQRASRSLLVLARLKSQISVRQARAAMEIIGQLLQQRFPQTNEGRNILVTPLREITNQMADRFVLILMGAALFVLLLACANVANLQLARAATQQREIAVRVALGAKRFQIARQLAAQTILIGLCGGVLGLFLGAWHVAWIRTTFPAAVLRWMAGLKDMHVDPWVLAFTLAASLVAGILCGLPAILQMLGGAAKDVNEVLKEGGRSASVGPSRGRLQSALVVAEVALALVLLVGAALMVKAFQGMLTIHAGFNPKNLLTAQVSLPSLKYRDDAQARTFYGQVLRGLQDIPEARSAAAVAHFGTPDGLFIEGRPDPRPGEPWPDVRAVSARSFETMQIPILRGRAISEQDGPDSQRVVVVSETIAKHYWPDSDPLGRRIKLGTAETPWLTIVGVSGDVKNWFTAQPLPRAYLSYLQSPSRSMALFVRTSSEPLLAAAGLRAKVHEVDKNQPVYDVKSMEQSLNEETSGVRVSASMMSMFAVIALLLAATGIYAVISYSVVQRTHEVGVRIALGASGGDVLKLTLIRAFYLAGIGLAVGLPAAFALTRLMSSVLFNVVALDWTVFAIFTGVLASSAILAGYLPARRAMKVDPVEALRHE